MARPLDREKAITLRKKGMSYSQIKEELGISKSTLHYWLVDYPLSEARIRELRDHSAQRIERCRETKARKRQVRLDAVLEKMRKDIGVLSMRELFIAGLFLYWAEGGKTKPYSPVLANSDPSMIVCYITWLRLLQMPDEKIVIRLQLYADMDVDKETLFWSEKLSLPRQCFRKPSMKKTTRAGLTHKGGFGHGTCDVVVNGRDLSEYILSGVRCLQQTYERL